MKSSLPSGPARTGRAESLFARAVAMPPIDQMMLLERECRTDSRLRDDLERLLELAHDLPQDGEPPASDGWSARDLRG